MDASQLLHQKIGAYYLEAIVGSGGMAVVYRARHEQHGSVALKVLFPPPNAGADLLARFEREARTVARLRHPAIVRVLEAGQAGGRAYLAMPLVEGESLADRLARSGALDEATAVDIAWQIADALDYAHRQGVIHRDVKPSNILLTREGRAVLTDFGVALALDDPTLTRTGHTIGTPAYMAPEQASGDRPVDGRADLYALGVVLYHMVAGRPPFRGATPHVLHAHVYEPPPAPSRLARVSPGLEAIILKALAKEAEQRFQTGAALALALARLEDQTTPNFAAALAATKPNLRVQSRRLGFPLSLAGLAAVLGLAAVITFFTFNRWPGFDQIRLAFNSQPTFTATPAATPLPTFTSTPVPTPTLTPPPPSDTPTLAPSPTLTPSATPAAVLPTQPPSPRPTSTPTPTPSATPCPQPIATTLALYLNTQPDRTGLGCPRAEAAVTAAAWEPFENGFMLWRADTNLIYVLRSNGTWSPASNTWREGDPAFDPAIVPPAGLYQPVRGFGNTWRTQPGVRDTLGWATAEEKSLSPLIQDFTGGSVWHDPERRSFFILFNNGAYQFSPP